MMQPTRFAIPSYAIFCDVSKNRHEIFSIKSIFR